MTVQQLWAFHKHFSTPYSMCLHFSQTPPLDAKLCIQCEKWFNILVDHVAHSSIQDTENMSSWGKRVFCGRGREGISVDCSSPPAWITLDSLNCSWTALWGVISGQSKWSYNPDCFRQDKVTCIGNFLPCIIPRHSKKQWNLLNPHRYQNGIQQVHQAWFRVQKLHKGSMGNV